MNKFVLFFKQKSNSFKFLTMLISILVWLILWEIASLIVNKKFLFPGASETLKALFILGTELSFWTTVTISLFRIFAGFLLGIILGTITAAICKIFPVTKDFITIGMTIIKSTPVAAVIMILWMFINAQFLPIAIALLMVCPVIWQNLMNGFSSIDNELYEVTVIYKFSKIKKLKYLIFPTLIKYFIPAALTSVGLAWKAGIASEIISYAKLSIGKNIYDAKWTFDGAEMLAWTLSVIIISLILENLIKYLTRRFSAVYEY